MILKCAKQFLIEIIDQLRSENGLVKEKLESREKELKDLEERMENCLIEEENQIKSLHNTIDQEIEVGKSNSLKSCVQRARYKDDTVKNLQPVFHKD